MCHIFTYATQPCASYSRDATCAVRKPHVCFGVQSAGKRTVLLLVCCKPVVCSSAVNPETVRDWPFEGQPYCWGKQHELGHSQVKTHARVHAHARTRAHSRAHHVHTHMHNFAFKPQNSVLSLWRADRPSCNLMPANPPKVVAKGSERCQGCVTVRNGEVEEAISVLVSEIRPTKQT
jgi:hypothetical protein